MGEYRLTHQERVTLDRAVARAMMGQSVLHPMGRPPTAIPWRETLVLQGQSIAYPRVANWVMPEHRKTAYP